VLLTNCDELPAVLNDRQGFFCIRGSDLDRLEAGDFRAMEAWLADAAFIAPKKSPQPHQTEALDALLPALQTHDRVSAIMACGTGKTLVALWVAEHVAQASWHGDKTSWTARGQDIADTLRLWGGAHCGHVLAYWLAGFDP
jgi:predicted helicase